MYLFLIVLYSLSRTSKCYFSSAIVERHACNPIQTLSQNFARADDKIAMHDAKEAGYTIAHNAFSHMWDSASRPYSLCICVLGTKLPVTVSLIQKLWSSGIVVLYCRILDFQYQAQYQFYTIRTDYHKTFKAWKGGILPLRNCIRRQNCSFPDIPNKSEPLRTRYDVFILNSV